MLRLLLYINKLGLCGKRRHRAQRMEIIIDKQWPKNMVNEPRPALKSSSLKLVGLIDHVNNDITNDNTADDASEGRECFKSSRLILSLATYSISEFKEPHLQIHL